MQINRIDIFLIGILFLQIQILFELIRILSFDAITAAIQGVSILAAMEVTVFAVAVSFSLKGLLLTVDAFFTKKEDELHLQAKNSGYALVASAFLLVTLITVIRASTNY